MDDLSKYVSRRPSPSKFACRLSLCRASRTVYHGRGEWHNPVKQNHATERIGGIFHLAECPDCGRVEFTAESWWPLNDAA